MKLQMHRQLFGLHMPMRVLMERKIVSQVRVYLCPSGCLLSSRSFSMLSVLACTSLHL